MGGNPRYRGKTAPITGSPVGPGSGGAGTSPVRIVNGFTSLLPGRSRRFFQRQFFANYPRPIAQAGASPFPRRITIARIQAPDNQSIVIRDVAFAAFQHSGIGVEDLSAVPNGRAVGTLGFEFLVGNQGMTDFATNLPGVGVPVTYTTAQGPGAVAPRIGQGSTFQGVGSIVPSTPTEPFAAYAMPSDLLTANAVLFRPPNFDIRIFEVKIEGWLVEAVELEKILDSLSR